MAFTYGVIEGLYDEDKLWSWQTRHEYVDFCANKGFDFFIYAPKNDVFLRERWREPWPETEFNSLKKLSSAFKEKGIRFGVGLTPFDVKTLDSQTKKDIKAKVKLINDINPTMLSILFDDFSNDVTNLADTQSAIAEFIAAESNAFDFQMVGTYYSSDPLLNRAYGLKPENYWSELGAMLDKRFDILWTGEHVISLGYDKTTLEYMSDLFQRQPFIWDNYPVNDPKWLKHRLRMYAFTGRPWQLSQWTSGHAVNPMIQPRLSKIPLCTLADIYQQKDKFIANSSFNNALRACCGEHLAKAIQDNLIYLTEEGANNFSPYSWKRLKTLFQSFKSTEQKPYADEILRWLDSVKETKDA
ncbi:MAG: beta-N-acetylglucosaminidase domain-containing protein [Endozoicomonas sp. (ex Botrylloides leachii)]|nr:beta-N-acetylglucosaminidase domain-containing protein [Endozoicomonas sp. (ex Botrylloides leachii)]